MGNGTPGFTITFGNAFEGQYDRKSKCLILTDVEEVSGRPITVRFPPGATRALYDLLVEAGRTLGEPIGSSEPRKKQ